MRVIRSLLPALVALSAAGLSSSACASAQSARADVRAEIQAVINEGLEATKSGDTARFLARLPADFVIERPDGSITTREELSQRLAGRTQNPPQTISLTATIERLDVRGDEATVITAQRWERRVHRADEATPRHVVSTQRHEELWRRRNGRWEGYRIKELGGDLIINGVRQATPAAAAAASAPPPPPPAAAAPAMQLERRWLDAYERNDAAAMASMLTDDFLITFPGGERSNKAQVLESVRRGAGGDPVKYWTQNVRAQVYGDTIILTGDVVSEVRRGSGATRSTMRYTDTYVERGGTWQVAASHLSNHRPPPGAPKPAS